MRFTFLAVQVFIIYCPIIIFFVCQFLRRFSCRGFSLRGIPCKWVLMFQNCLSCCFQSPLYIRLPFPTHNPQLSGDHVKIIGVGRHVPGYDDERLQKPKTGTIISTKEICKWLREEKGIHNPKNGKTISDDWAIRNLHIETLPHSTNNLKKVINPDALMSGMNASEQELCINSFEEALSNSGLKVCDLDGIIHNSPTLENPSFTECLQFWYKKYPELQSAQVHVHLSHGCPGLLHALILAKSMLLHNIEMKNIAVICSAWCSGKYFKKRMDKVLSTNDILKWLGICIFSDGAVTLILSNLKDHQVPIALNIVDVKVRVQHDLQVGWKRSAVADDGSVYPEFYLNMHAQSLYASDFLSWFKEMSKKYGYSFSDFQHFVFHQANPRVISRLSESCAFGEKTMISGKKYANLPGPSLPCDLFERMMSVEMKDQDLIFGYGMGAAMGNSSGYFILQVEKNNILDI